MIFDAAKVTVFPHSQCVTVLNYEVRILKRYTKSGHPLSYVLFLVLLWIIIAVLICGLSEFNYTARDSKMGFSLLHENGFLQRKELLYLHIYVDYIQIPDERLDRYVLLLVMLWLTLHFWAVTPLVP